VRQRLGQMALLAFAQEIGKRSSNSHSDWSGVNDHRSGLVLPDERHRGGRRPTSRESIPAHSGHVDGDIPAEISNAERNQGTRLTLFPIWSERDVVTWAPGVRPSPEQCPTLALHGPD